MRTYATVQQLNTYQAPICYCLMVRIEMCTLASHSQLEKTIRNIDSSSHYFDVFLISVKIAAIFDIRILPA